MATKRLGYYVHHYGTGHLLRALQIIPHIPAEVFLFSSMERPSMLPDNCTFIHLPNDKITGFEQPKTSTFMYTPYDNVVMGRYQVLLDTIRKHEIRSMYVDVSLEVALFCKLLGLTVGHNAMQGVRDDAAHDHLYSALDYYVSDSTPELNTTTTRNGPVFINYVGGISRFKKSSPKPVTDIHDIVVTTSPASMQVRQTDIIKAARSFTNITWHIIGPSDIPGDMPDNLKIHGVVVDPYQLYKNADLIVGAGGHNTIMEAASLGRPFMCIPENRPYKEQLVAAQALAMHSMALHEDAFPSPARWHELLPHISTIDTTAFQTLVDDNAAQNAAKIIYEHAR